MGTIVSLKGRLQELETNRKPVKSRAEVSAEMEASRACHLAMSDAEFNEAERQALARFDFASYQPTRFTREHAKIVVASGFQALRRIRSGEGLPGVKHRQP